MFRLAKILNSGVNVAEPCRIPADNNTIYHRGTMLKLSEGALTNAAATDKPTLIAIESKGKEGGTLLCSPISGNMIFECPIGSSPLSLRVGDKVTLHLNDGFAVGVTATTVGGVAEIIDLNGAAVAGDTVFVRIV